MSTLLRTVYDRHLDFLTLRAIEGWPMWSRVLLAILLVDFLGWFHHLVRHKVTMLWHFHALHHSQREMNLFTDVRVHPIDRIASQTIQFVPLFMVHASFPVITGWVLFHQVWTKLCHANLRLSFGPLRYVLVTPQSHRVHHSCAVQHADKNFGVMFSIWDRLLGTYYEQRDEYPECGVDDPGFPMEYARTPGALVRSTWAQLVYPFLQLRRSLVPSR
ncbi:sterol desaturase family protein [Candidatus Binatia bacterium]|nr:sterol desaturase family protein [Candidatus Binatia bacterium]